jgi:hypothetical protein
VVFRFVFDTGERLWFLAVLRHRFGRFLPVGLRGDSVSISR